MCQLTICCLRQCDLAPPLSHACQTPFGTSALVRIYKGSRLQSEHQSIRNTNTDFYFFGSTWSFDRHYGANQFPERIKLYSKRTGRDGALETLDASSAPRTQNGNSFGTFRTQINVFNGYFDTVIYLRM